MDWRPEAKDVEAAWRNFRTEWDFRKSPRLYLPLYEQITMFKGMARKDGALKPKRIWKAIVSVEYGRQDGERAYRLVGRVPDTDVEVVLETGLLK